MSPEPYWERLHDSRDPLALRLKMVRLCLEHARNISLTAQAFRCSTKTVRYWLARFQTQGAQGLADRRGRHHSRPNKTPPQVEALVVELKRCYPFAGQ
ncbi:MAG: helix-turn-helix domain-containing protein, partial [candidate division KSB1 bacterium]|nr:helix-turn-helix domain-containing protein [candidate division KSB1 bacterium]